MSLFQNSVLNKYLKGLESEKVNEAYHRFISHFHNPTIQENIRNSKEEQYQGEFLIDLFVTVFGYTKNPAPNFNLTTELKNIKGSKKTDGAILSIDKSDTSRDLSPLAKAVIELKGTNTTDLSKVEAQAFGYKNNQPGCNYVITSNFEKLRFYIDNAVDFEEFNLFQLSKERFEILWLCLSSEYLLKDIPKKIKDESLTQEENVTKKLYKDYASFRNEIFDAIQKENPEYDKLTLFKKTQKLLDRFLFIFFAEDRLLLPPNSIRAIVNQWTDLRDKYDEYFPLYDRFKKYFGYMNTGHKGQQHDIFAYNGGLFAPDDILDNIKINDDLLHKHTLNLSNYDFESEVSVNILGHIFEHSLNDIDEIQNNLNGLKSVGKRKKDGVFYTPKYITKYIVDNTVGKLCEEKKAELDIQEAEYEKERKGRQKATLKKLNQKLEDYRKWLLQITICDPACGSGAFLNQALEFLIAEHRYIDELQAKLFGDAMVLSDIENAILENNLFGVDINEESVEIAKLSLWLRTAQKGRKLTTLNNNIKCGNSLIDDPTVAGDKAFNWQNEFPDVFKEKDKKAYHITTAIHDSRTSARMKKYKVREQRDGGTNPYPNVIYFTPEDDLLITQTIADIVEEDKLNLLAYNICADHIHLLVVCDLQDIPSIMQKIKGRTSYHKGLNHKELNLKGLKSLDKEKNKPLWSQKYSTPKEVTTQEQLYNTIRYIQTNRNKHELPPHNKKLQNLIDTMCCSIDKAFTPEYTGGFDVVIGNPPYVRQELLGKKQKGYFSEKYSKVYNSIADIYVYFYQASIEILKKDGYLGFITPNKWMERKYGFELREYLKALNILELINYGELRIFADASTEPEITIIKNEFDNSEIAYTIVKTLNDAQSYNYEFGKFPKKKLGSDIWRFNNDIINSILTKFKNTDISLGNYTSNGIYYGIKTGLNKAFIIDQSIKDQIISKDQNSENILKKMVEGDDFGKWSLNHSGRYMVATGYNTDIPNKYPAVHNYLKQFEDKLVKRQDKGINYWNLRACDYYDQLEQPKLIYYHTAVNHSFYYDIEGYYISANCYFISNADRYIQCVLNSKLFNCVKKYLFPAFGDSENGGRVRLDANKMVKLPIMPVSKSTKSIYENKAVIISDLSSDLQSRILLFLNHIKSKFNIEKPSKKLQNWHELEFGEFLKELESARKKATMSTDLSPLGAYAKLSLNEEAEWMQYFNEQKQKAEELKAEIDKTDKAIDQMVYELYGLTEEEIAIVEEATK